MSCCVFAGRLCIRQSVNVTYDGALGHTAPIAISQELEAAGTRPPLGGLDAEGWHSGQRVVKAREAVDITGPGTVPGLGLCAALRHQCWEVPLPTTPWGDAGRPHLWAPEGAPPYVPPPPADAHLYPFLIVSDSCQ